MATSHPIQPFPPDIDRDAFGHWISGFTDGEGCFFLGLYEKDGVLCPRATFAIAVRQDDLPVVRMVHSYFGVGRVWTGWKRQPTTPRQRPRCDFSVSKFSDLAAAIVPHFDRFPLRAKKVRDYLIWREAVLYAASILPPKRRSGNGGFRPNWDATSRAYMAELSDALRRTRRFAMASGSPDRLPDRPTPAQMDLFHDSEA